MMTETEWVVVISMLAIIAFICIAMWIIKGAIDDLQHELMDTNMRLWHMFEKDGENDGETETNN